MFCIISIVCNIVMCKITGSFCFFIYKKSLCTHKYFIYVYILFTKKKDDEETSLTQPTEPFKIGLVFSVPHIIILCAFECQSHTNCCFVYRRDIRIKVSLYYMKNDPVYIYSYIPYHHHYYY